MSDIFISYASEDRELAKTLAHVLENQGWSVWWDRKIPYGKNYDEVIAENLATARCVIVLWTTHSVNSRWVRAEASEAAERNTLIPILLAEKVRIPLQFKLLQAANLFDWKSDDVAHPEFERLLTHIKELLTISQPATQPGQNQLQNPGVIPPTIPPDSKVTSKIRKKALLILGLMVFPSLLAGGIVFALMNWRIATRIQADLIVDRVELTLGGTEPMPLWESGPGFRSLTLERFSQLTFSPKKLEIMTAVPALSKNDRVHLIDSLQNGDKVMLRGEKNRFAKITIESLNEGAELVGRVEKIRIEPGTTVIFDATYSSSHAFTLQLSGTMVALDILPAGPFKMIASNILSKDRMPPKLKINPISMRVEPREGNFIKLESEPDAFTVTLTPANSEAVKFLADRGSPVSKIQFLKQNEMGDAESTLIRAGKIVYADFPDIDPVVVDQSHFLRLDSLKHASIKHLYYDPEQNGFVLRLEGEAGDILSRAGELRKDHRLTLFDKFWHDPRWVILFSIVFWLCPVTIGAYKLYQEVKKRA